MFHKVQNRLVYMHVYILEMHKKSMHAQTSCKVLTTGLPGKSLLFAFKSDTTERPHFHFSFSCIGEGNGNPLQCSCLENPRDSPRDGGAWWAAVYGVAQSRVGHDWSDLAAAAAAAAAAAESWTIKKAEHQWSDAFELWCWRRLLRVPWRARRSNQSILKKSNLIIHWKNWC